MACNNYLNLYYAYSRVHVHSILFMPMFICEVPRICDVCFLVNLFCLKKLNVSVLLAKLDDPICQTGLSGFDR
jgi:hypothetical protein